jgi:hypothetical protein
MNGDGANVPALASSGALRVSKVHSAMYRDGRCAPPECCMSVSDRRVARTTRIRLERAIKNRERACGGAKLQTRR